MQLELPAYKKGGRQWKVKTEQLVHQLLDLLQQHKVPVLCLDNDGNVRAVTFIEKVDHKERIITLSVNAECSKLIVQLKEKEEKKSKLTADRY